MDILLGSSSGPLGKLLSGKNAPLILALLPVLLQLFSSQQSGKAEKPKGKKKRGDQGDQSGLDSILESLTSGGLGDIVGSWIGSGPNKKITPSQVRKGLGPETIGAIAQQAGLSTADTAKGMAALLPVLVNQVTPRAEVPEPSALEMALQGLSGLLPRS